MCKTSIFVSLLYTTKTGYTLWSRPIFLSQFSPALRDLKNSKSIGSSVKVKSIETPIVFWAIFSMEPDNDCIENQKSVTKSIIGKANLK